MQSVNFWIRILMCCFLPVVDEDGDKASVSAKKRRVESFQQKEKRKRDLGQATSDKSFVEEEKRILRQNADWGLDLVETWALIWVLVHSLGALTLRDCPTAFPLRHPHTPLSSPVSSPRLCEWSSARLPSTQDIDVIETFGLLFVIPWYIFDVHIIQTLVETAFIPEFVCL